MRELKLGDRVTWEECGGMHTGIVVLINHPDKDHANSYYIVQMDYDPYNLSWPGAKYFPQTKELAKYDKCRAVFKKSVRLIARKSYKQIFRETLSAKA